MSKQAGKFQDSKRVSNELFTLTYGSLVTQLLKDYDNVEDVNKVLERMGYNIGIRLVDDFLARTGSQRCLSLKDTADKLQTAFKMYLGSSVTVGNWTQAEDEFSLFLDNNPLIDFVEIPSNLLNLKYCNLISGVIRGALEMVQIEVQCSFLQDQLKGDNVTELRIKFIRCIEDAIPAGED